MPGVHLASFSESTYRGNPTPCLRKKGVWDRRISSTADSHGIWSDRGTHTTTPVGRSSNLILENRRLLSDRRRMLPTSHIALLLPHNLAAISGENPTTGSNETGTPLKHALP